MIIHSCVGNSSPNRKVASDSRVNSLVGPVATKAEADRLISESLPDAALVDVNLRGGERADCFIDRLHDQGVRVAVTSGSSDHPLAPRNAMVTLSKPFSEAQFFAALIAMATPAKEGGGS